MPPQLLIIADDLTGANDTGVQFAKQGIESLVVIDPAQSLAPFDCHVLVVNTESRHVSPDEAFRRVQHVAQQGVQLSIPQFYKKTDSTLRGNVGSELAALVAATSGRELFFAPAYPKLQRTTRAGVQFVNDQPLDQSSFAHDPLNPMREASIAAIIAQQTNLTVTPFDPAVAARNAPTIYVVDAETDDDLRRAAHWLKAKKLLAGAAGFAECLAEVMPLERASLVPPSLFLPLLVVNGSLHEASLRQVAHAAQHGWTVLEVTAATSVTEIIAALNAAQRVVLTTSTNALDELFTAKMASLVAQILRQQCVPALAVFGGDTLAAIAAACDWTAFRPRLEFVPGVPLVEVCGANEVLLLTKAGGFGAADFITQNLGWEKVG